MAGDLRHAGQEIAFAHTSFKWANLAKHNAGVTVAIVGMSNDAGRVRKLYSIGEDGDPIQRETENINAYLVPAANVVVRKASDPLTGVPDMSFGNKPVDGGNLLLTRAEVAELGLSPEQEARWVRRIYGSREFIRGKSRYCLWIEDANLDNALAVPVIRERVESVRTMRLKSAKKPTRMAAERAHRFGEVRQSGSETAIIVPIHSSESREYPSRWLHASRSGRFQCCVRSLQCPALAPGGDRLSAAPRLDQHGVRQDQDGLSLFETPRMEHLPHADAHREEPRRSDCLRREHPLGARFPATIAELYAPGRMPENLRAAHDRNDEVLARISHTVTAEGFGGSVGAEFCRGSRWSRSKRLCGRVFREARVAGTAA